MAATVHAPLLRLVEQVGSHADVTLDGLGRLLSTGADGHVAFDLPNGTRLRLEPNSRACVLDFEPSAVVLYAGSASAELLPQGNPAGLTGSRLIGSQASLAIPNMAEVWLAEHAWIVPPHDGVATQSYLAIVRGSGELQRFAPDASLRVESIVAGQDVSSGVGPKAPEAKTRESALRTSAELMKRRRDPLRLLDVDARLEHALAQIGEERQRGADLIARIMPQPGSPIAVRGGPLKLADAGVASGSPAARLGAVSEVRAYQRALASHAQHKLQLKQTMLLAAEQSLFAALASCASPASECASLSDWRARFLARIRSSL